MFDKYCPNIRRTIRCGLSFDRLIVVTTMSSSIMWLKVFEFFKLAQNQGFFRELINVYVSLNIRCGWKVNCLDRSSWRIERYLQRSPRSL